VQLAGVDLLASLASTDYNPSTEKWTVTMYTSVSSPFKLQNPSIRNITGSLAYNNRTNASSLRMSDAQPCVINGTGC